MAPEQQRLFELLREIVEICEREGIRYYAAGGTTLGAVRHGGFIPWDDDVDLMMPRDDWNRFVDVARNGGLPEGRVLSCHELNADYPHVFGRYTDTTSCCVHYNQMLGGTPEGFIVDIFALDAVPDARNAYQQHRELLSLYNDLSNPLGYSYPMSADRTLLKRWSKRVKEEGRAAVFQELEERLARYDEEACDYLVMRWAAAPRLFRKEVFAYERFEWFEGLRLRVPALCNDYLTYHYGDDFMYVPPDSARLVHDAATFVDIDYKTFQSDYLPFVDAKRTRAAILNRREHHIRHMDELREADELKARICASFVRKVTLARAESCGFDIDHALADGRFADLEGIFCDFYRWQCAPEIEGREEYLGIYRYHKPLCIDIGDELLYAAVANLAHTNRMGKAARILRVHEQARGTLAGEAARARQLVDALRMPASLLDVGLKREAVEFAEWLLEAFPQNFSNRLFVAERLYRAGDFDRLKEVAQGGLAYFPESGEYAKYLADCDYALAQTDEDVRDALHSYGAALAHTTHKGLVDDVRVKVQKRPHAAEDELEALLACKASAVQAVPALAASPDAARIGQKAACLLAEVADICETVGIEYCLGPESCRLALACGDDSVGAPVLDILVPASQLPKLAAELEHAAASREESDRAVDFWGTNGRYLRYQIDYADKTTTFLQLDEGTDIGAHGVKVRIVPIRSLVPGKQGKRLAALEDGWEANGYKLTKKVTRRSLTAATQARAFMSRGRKRAARRLFAMLTDAYGNAAFANEAVDIHLPGKAAKTFSAQRFDCCDALCFCGRSYPVPGDVRSFLEECLGPGWDVGASEAQQLPTDTLVSSELPYEQLISELNDEELSPARLFAAMRRIRLLMIPMANDLRIRNRALLLASRSEARKRLYDELHPHDGEINAALSSGDFETLQVLLEGYEREALRFLGRGLALCPCKNHLDALRSLLHHKNMTDKADKLARLAPVKHYKPLAGNGKE